MLILDLFNHTFLEIVEKLLRCKCATAYWDRNHGTHFTILICSLYE